MDSNIGIGFRRATVAALTGGWLALMQVALAFTLLAGAGASALLFFALTGAWLGGGALGGLFVRGRAVTVLLAVALVGSAGALLFLKRWPFSPAGTAVGLVAGALCGAYAAAFLVERSARWGNVRSVLLHENNGFVLGWIIGAALLIVSAKLLAVSAMVLGVALLAARVVGRETGISTPAAEAG